MRPKVFLLDLVDPERSLDDPALRALVAQGWTCSGAWPAVQNDGAGGPERVRLMLLLWPPASAIDRPGRAEVPRSRVDPVWLAGILGLLTMAVAVAASVARWLS